MDVITMSKPRHKPKKLLKRKQELLKHELELEELQVALKFTALNSKVSIMEHYQHPKGVNYR
jgi:hypothetical protein